LDKELSEHSLNFQEILESLPRNITIVDSFTKAESLLCKGKFKKIVVSVSGGSDSDLIVDIVTRLNIKATYVYFDTGLEYKATKEHLTYLEQRYGIEIARIRSKCPVPLAVKRVGQPFLSKQVSEYIARLQKVNFKWEDRPYEELVKEYPNSVSALKWWCNYKGEDEKPSMFNISRNKWLKEFLIGNPPTFPISNRCCDLAKKQSVECNEHILDVVGIRKVEGGVRAGHNTCVTFGHHNIYRPIFWYSQADKEEYEQFADIQHSECYTEYGLKRTGCAGCPFGRNFEYELEVLKEHEPNLYKAVCNIFKDSYEYTRKYKKFCERKENLCKREKIGYQLNIFDYEIEDK
jgi:3'-phosphoadenosine 5'-phosphosulfate sulfotransferase (PAPS reductase)/FAD synthetase